MINKRVLIYAIGIGSLVANSMTLYAIIVGAYFSDNYSININYLGEAHLEMILIPVTIIIGTWTVFHMFRNEVRNESQTLRSSCL